MAGRIRGLTDAVGIGHGGFADVYRAFQPTFESFVAVKVSRDLVLDETRPTAANLWFGLDANVGRLLARAAPRQGVAIHVVT